MLLNYSKNEPTTNNMYVVTKKFITNAPYNVGAVLKFL